MLLEYFSAAEALEHSLQATGGNFTFWVVPGLGETSPPLLPYATPPFPPHQHTCYIFSAWCLSPAPLLLSCQTINHKCIGIFLGPVSLHATNVAAHESGWLEKRDVPLVALSWQAECWCPFPQDSVCFQCPDGCMFLSITNLCKKVSDSKDQPCYPKANSRPLIRTPGQVKNIFSPLAMTCKFSLRLSVLIVR